MSTRVSQIPFFLVSLSQAADNCNIIAWSPNLALSISTSARWSTDTATIIIVVVIVRDKQSLTLVTTRPVNK